MFTFVAPGFDAHRHLQLPLESSGRGLDLVGCRTFVNPAAALMPGCRTEQVLGHTSGESRMSTNGRRKGEPLPRGTARRAKGVQ
jgi:hypothetical protein